MASSTLDLDTTSLLDLLDAITECRVQNPDLRPAVLSALRLCSANGHVRGGRLYSLNQFNEITAIIAHGDSSLSEDDDRGLIGQVCDSRDPAAFGQVVAYPLGKDQRLFSVLLLEEPCPTLGPLLADLFLQWHAVAEFMSVQKAELIDENFQLREEIKLQFAEHDAVGVSGAFNRVLESARRVASSTATVLIHGETGTGKELVARMIHDNSARCNNPFITVNCGALSESLLETELFGHVKGAFTGATSDRKGRFEAAHGGTIFLDEIGEISPAMQVRLLRVLQEMEVVRVGETKSRKLDVRIVAATNRNLEEEVANERFRSDLYYRLNVVYLQIPPLRQRKEDIPVLAEHFLNRYCQRNCKYIEHIDRSVLEIMTNYHWPGNVRELENCIEKMVVMAPGNQVTPDLLPMSMMAFANTQPQSALEPLNDNAEPVPAESFEDTLRRFLQAETARANEEGAQNLYDLVRAKWERHLFDVVLDLCRNNKSRAARLLGITRNTLNARMGDLCHETREWRIE